MKRLNSTDEKVMHIIEKFNALTAECNAAIESDLNNFNNNLNQFKQSLLLIKEINKLSSSIALNKSDFEDIDNDVANILDDMAEEYKNIKQSLIVIKEKNTLLRGVKQ